MTADATLLWLTDTHALAPAWFDNYAWWLAESEQLRCARFVRDARRRQFIAARILLRLALGRLLGVAPRTVTLRDRPGNAPELVAPRRTDLYLSIAHSGQWVACVASVRAPVGLDIECLDPARDLVGVAAQAFGARAAAQLAGLGAEARIQAFYAMWCRYEAHLKLGTGGIGKRIHDYSFALPGLAMVLSSTQEMEVQPAVIDLAGCAHAAWPGPDCGSRTQSTPKSK